VLFNLLNLMITTGEKVSTVSEAMQGQIPGQNTKATVAMAAIEQGMKVFSAVYKRVHRAMAKEFKKLYHLNSIYLEKESYFTILDAGAERGEEITLEDYNTEDVDIVPVSDPNVATMEQRLAKVQALFELMAIGTINKQEVTKRYLEATEQPNIEGLMEVPKPPPNPEVEMKKAEFEHKVDIDWAEEDRLDDLNLTLMAKNLAEAEAAEDGQQLQQYIDVAKGINAGNDARQKRDQSREDHQARIADREEKKQKEAQAAQGQGGPQQPPQARGKLAQMGTQRREPNAGTRSRAGNK
jgi:hypothetical protein